MKKKCEDFSQLQKENIALRDNLEKYHKGDMLNIQSH